MKRNILFIVSIIALFNLQTYGQQSPMDEYENDMKIEYRRHNIANITNYILKHKEVGKSQFIIDGKLYKMKVKNSAMNGGYVKKDNTKDDSKWVEGESLQFMVKHMHREYVYTLRGNKLQLWSDNLSFFAYYDFEIKEVSIRKDGYNFNSSSYKMYAYDYSFANNKLEKVQDWVVADRIGRANSIK